MRRTSIAAAQARIVLRPSTQCIEGFFAMKPVFRTDEANAILRMSFSDQRTSNIWSRNCRNRRVEEMKYCLTNWRWHAHDVLGLSRHRFLPKVWRGSCALLLVLLVACNGSGNLIKNPFFEKGDAANILPEHWAMEVRAKKPVLSWDKISAKDGSKSIKIEVNGAGNARWYQEVEAEYRSLYRLTGWIRTENVEIGGASLAVYSGEELITTTDMVKGDSEWVRVTVDVDEYDDDLTVAARLSSLQRDDCAAWFDDIQFYKIADGQ